MSELERQIALYELKVKIARCEREAGGFRELAAMYPRASDAAEFHLHQAQIRDEQLQRLREEQGRVR